METSHNITKIAQYNGNKSQHNEISTTQQKQATIQWNYHNTTETSHNTMKLAQHNGNKSQHNEISTTQRDSHIIRKQATTQRKQVATQRKQVSTQ